MYSSKNPIILSRDLVTLSQQNGERDRVRGEEPGSRNREAHNGRETWTSDTNFPGRKLACAWCANLCGKSLDLQTSAGLRNRSVKSERIVKYSSSRARRILIIRRAPRESHVAEPSVLESVSRIPCVIFLAIAHNASMNYENACLIYSHLTERTSERGTTCRLSKSSPSA